jgi:hypothetical protein
LRHSHIGIALKKRSLKQYGKIPYYGASYTLFGAFFLLPPFVSSLGGHASFSDIGEYRRDQSMGGGGGGGLLAPPPETKRRSSSRITLIMVFTFSWPAL